MEDDAGREAKRKAKIARDSQARREKIANDPEYAEEHRRKKREDMRNRYQNDPAYRERTRGHHRARSADPEKRAHDARRNQERRSDPDVYAAELARNRRREADRKAIPPGHPGTCDICGVRPPPKSNGKRGLCQDHRHDNNAIRGYVCNRCNVKLAVLDLRFMDPDYFAALLAFSLREAPVTPVKSEVPRRRRAPAQHPKLFE